MAGTRFAALMWLALALAPAYAGPEPAWAQLSENERKVLAPLASEWDTLLPWQREKMLEIAHAYPRMSAEQQQRVQHRLTNWSRMTPYERDNARKHYQQFSTMPPEKQKALRHLWQEYNKLPETERQRLRMEAVPEDELGR